MKENFIKCGFIGWGAELIFTSLHRLNDSQDKRMIGQTSLFMFPIYGMAAMLRPVCNLLRGKSLFLRGSIYTSLIFMTEYISGRFLRRIKRCPWDYSNAPLNVDGLIRLDYAPLWFFLGLVFEFMTGKKPEKVRVIKEQSL